MNDFYSIGEENKDLENTLQLENLGSQRPGFITGKRDSTAYRKTVDEDYDELFASKIRSIKPPYDISLLLNYHLDFYINQKNGSKDKFVRHIKNVVSPLFLKYPSRTPYINLLKEWIADNEMKGKNDDDDKIIKLQNENTILDHKLKSWQISTRWWAFIILIIGSIIGIATLVYNIYFKK